MLDLIGALVLSANLVIVLIVIVGFAATGRSARVVAFAVASAWVAVVVALAATGRFGPGAIGPVPGPPLAFAVTMIAALGAWGASPRFRNALLAVPLPWLVGINSLRIGGVFFLILFAQHRLSAPFAPSAGLGDIITGLGALWIVARIAAGRVVSSRQLAIWNAFGALDLVTAITLGALSAPTPIQVFTGSDELAVASLPWVIIPTLLVPLYLLVHLTVATRLASRAESRRLSGETVIVAPAHSAG
jgi:hypothetical protein